MKYNFDEIVNRRNTYSMKWDGGDLLKQIGLADQYDEETIKLMKQANAPDDYSKEEQADEPEEYKPVPVASVKKRRKKK